MLPYLSREFLPPLFCYFISHPSFLRNFKVQTQTSYSQNKLVYNYESVESAFFDGKSHVCFFSLVLSHMSLCSCFCLALPGLFFSNCISEHWYQYYPTSQKTNQTHYSSKGAFVFYPPKHHHQLPASHSQITQISSYLKLLIPPTFSS